MTVNMMCKYCSWVSGCNLNNLITQVNFTYAILTWPSAWKHLIEFYCCESFKIYVNVPYRQQQQSQINLFTLLSLCNKVWKMFSGNSFNTERHLLYQKLLEYGWWKTLKFTQKSYYEIINFICSMPIYICINELKCK